MTLAPAMPDTASPIVDNITRLLYFKLVLQLGKIGGYFFSGITLAGQDALSMLGLLLAVELGVNLVGFTCLKQHWLKAKQGIFILLLADIVFLVAFLYFFGGATNPFISLLLLPVAISATLLRPSHTWLLSLAAVIGYSVLMPFADQAPMVMSGHDMAGHDMSAHQMAGHDMSAHQGATAGHAAQSHFWGMWVNFLISVSVLTLFVVTMSRALRQRDRQLAEFRQEQLRNEQAVALGTMAATAAHELATPLSTLQLLSDELAFTADQDERQTQLQLMAQQLQRCQQILTGLRQSTQDLQQNKHQIQSARELMEQLIEQWLVVRPDISLKHQLPDDDLWPVRTNPSLLPALMNLLDNAADATLDNGGDHIEMHCGSDDGQLQITIRDFGKGIQKPYPMQHKQIMASSKADGMGIGLFLANTSIEKLQGQVRLENQPYGMLTIINLPIVPPPVQHSPQTAPQDVHFAPNQAH